MNKKEITIQDCLDMYYKKGQAVILENGQVVGFVKEIKHESYKWKRKEIFRRYRYLH